MDANGKPILQLIRYVHNNPIIHLQIFLLSLMNQIVFSDIIKPTLMQGHMLISQTALVINEVVWQGHLGKFLKNA